MKLTFVDVQNFRKLKTCRIEFSEKETVFVGANNSGKTSAMDALMMFLKKTKRLSTTDFTLSNWTAINKIAVDWLSDMNSKEINLTKELWMPLIPSVDVWLQVEDKEIHYVSHIIPTLDWTGGKLGIRLIFEPKSVENLYKAYKRAYEAAINTVNSRKKESTKEKVTLKLWPQSMRDFLDKELHKHFSVSAYILDPLKCAENLPQSFSPQAEPIEGDPLAGLFKIDVINAQRGFSDPNAGEGNSNSDRRLSAQLRGYFENHLNPEKLPDLNDLDALEAIEVARTAFDKRLKESFESSIGELENLNYPGFSDPQIILSSKVNPLEGLNHGAAVQFNVFREDVGSGDISLCLPEKYNGLGYQNLISMIFNLIRFRDEWMRVGKAGRKINDADNFIEPLHLVLIEEPEAHLHAQVQQVFIKKAYDVLRKHSNLGNLKLFSTQLVISTHSSHIAHQIDFKSLRYFQRRAASCLGDVPCATVVNLTKTFGDNSDTSKFATRYLKTTHCDLFFADAAILVEGPAERMLVPHFIRSKFPELDKSYISLLEIGGSHAHRLRPLIEALGLLTLVVTDLDSIGENDAKKVIPEKGENYRTGNETIKSWAPGKTVLDEVLGAKPNDKVKNELVRVAYQHEMKVTFSNREETVIPYTFEDALVLTNIDLFKSKSDSKGLIKKMADAVSQTTLAKACSEMFEALKSGKKAEMALELLYSTKPEKLLPPLYILEGLKWLKEQIENRSKDFIKSDKSKGGTNE